MNAASSKTLPSLSNPFKEMAGLSWQANLALAISTLLGAILLVILSPLLLMAGIWLGWTKGMEHLARESEARNYSLPEGAGAALSTLSISGSGSAPNSTAR